MSDGLDVVFYLRRLGGSALGWLVRRGALLVLGFLWGVCVGTVLRWVFF